MAFEIKAGNQGTDRGEAAGLGCNPYRGLAGKAATVLVVLRQHDG
jgi:hypothetical protein